ncbi:hypothetical protein L6654_09520 [Bradyrhizobium sp. WYCCWR 13023]|uniref:Uncharacterized protein n=1 Tax=Bradyrhizobium zhengyangense TaxID=2911009 RepID=A0A9X1R8B5_9BRAD|nr:hypothetical protein [Bradyrhizobium zhengyangense]MCG2626862.1 hypothetical protein [Bradyrhizobium zhengyangense]MCG2638051.1 hypothetical protein [Bradyrhizobium zhengyangense]MCG2666451.1 hypothetical protein [Bradyrhizobium zhengyangense]
MDTFSAFSSIDYQSIRAKTPAETAVKRLSGIGEVLSGLDIATIRSQDDMARGLRTLDTADKCIRMILTEFKSSRTKDVVREANRLIDLIELARDEISGLHHASGVLS